VGTGLEEEEEEEWVRSLDGNLDRRAKEGAGKDWEEWEEGEEWEEFAG